MDGGIYGVGDEDEDGGGGGDYDDKSLQCDDGGDGD